MITVPQKLELESIPEKPVQDRFSRPEGFLPEKKIRVYDPKTGKTWGYVVVDNTRRGPGLGGIRIAPDLSLEEVSRLAYVMSLKNSGACLPYGGGKAGIVADPQILRSYPTLKDELVTRFAEAIFDIPDYIPAPDMGTDEKDIQRIFDIYSERLGTRVHRRGGAGRPPEKGGVPIDGWGLTAQGLFAAAKTLELLDSKFKIAGSRVIIQGYGNVGSGTASKLVSAGAVIVGASDINAALWNSQGLDLAELNRIRHEACGLAGYTGPVERHWGPNRLDWILEGPCEILVPAARPDAITSRNADRIRCRVILQGANTPSNKMTEYYLKHRRGIESLSDFLVNAGGVIGCAVELELTANTAYREKIESHGEQTYLEELVFSTVSKNVSRVMERLSAPSPGDRIFREEALALARERLNAPAPEFWL
ncbi:MAG: hypothetical protein COV67_02255 [Nitrospinae bacterium CG11_big_fil_rev_8_21_14_0_20_56_8]|nr:MAG: hypothetical protein COV67_02255 [Nitrospinae bacterium CG11_big_fil_rev_8_21_14_0_20_56_8]